MKDIITDKEKMFQIISLSFLSVMAVTYIFRTVYYYLSMR